MNDVIWIVKDLSTNNILLISSDNSEIENFMKNCKDKSLSCNKYVHDTTITALQAKLEKAVEALKNIKSQSFTVSFSSGAMHSFAKEALKELEAE